MSDLRNLITLAGYQKFIAELEHLTQKERPELLKTIAWAASNGDRSENADYQYGKKRLREIERRLRFLSKRLKEVRPIDISKIKASVIQFGATVWLENEAGQIKKYTLVGIDEVEPRLGLISLQSPLGQSLLGKEEGDEIVVKAPKGEVYYTVTQIGFVQFATGEE